MTETEKYSKESQDYLNQVHQAMTTGRFDKRVLIPNANDAKFSQAADDHRQVKAIDRANGQIAQGAPEIIDLGEGESTPQGEIIDLSEGNSVRSKGIGEKVLSTVTDLFTPRTSVGDLTSSDFLNNLALSATGGAAVGSLAGPGGMVAGGVAGALSAPLFYEGYKREVEKFTKMGYTPEEAQAAASKSSSVLGLASGLVGKVPGPQSRIKVGPTSMEPHEAIGGIPTEIPRPDYPGVSTPSVSPQTLGQAVMPTVQTPLTGYQVRPTGRFVLPTGAQPSITDLAQAHQARMLGDIPTGAFHDPNAPAMPVTEGMDRLARTDMLLGTEYVAPETIAPFDKPRALRTAEELLQERQRMESKPLHGQPNMGVREANSFVPNGPSVSATEGAARGAQVGLTRANKASMAKAQQLQEAREQVNLDFAKQYVDELNAKEAELAKSAPKLPSGELPKTFDGMNTEGLFPSVRRRMVGDVLSVIGEFSPAWRGASESILKAYESAGRQASTSLDDFTNAVSGLFGERSWFTQKGMAFKELTKGENIAIASTQRSLKLSEPVAEAAFNYLYTDGRMMPPATLSEAERTQAIKYADLVYEKMLKPTSEHPGVRLTPIYDPITGESFLPGAPSRFVPHQPIKEITRQALKDHQWQLLYERMGGKEGTKGDLQTFINRVVAFSKRDPEVGVQIFNMPGLQQKRLLDLEALGGSPYQQAKKLGYETDLFAAAVRHRTNGVLRGELQLLKPGVDALLKASDYGAEGNKWLNKALSYAMKNPHGADQVQPFGTDVMVGTRRWLDSVLLGKALLTNLTQFAYPISRAMGTPVLGSKAITKGTMDYVFGNNAEMIKQSGALLPYHLNQFSHPTGPLATFHSNVMQMYGMPWVDRQTRLFAGHIGNQYVDALAKRLLNNPTKQVTAKLVNELGGPKAAEAILAQGKVPDTLRLEMIQRFANNTAGVLDSRGLPWFATSENPFAKAVLQYKPFLLANSAEIRRSIMNAPTKAIAATRFATLMTGGAVGGTAIYEAKQLFNHLVQGSNYEPPNRDGVYAVERLLGGLGGAYATTMFDLVEHPERTGASLVGGPAMGYVTGFAKDIKMSLDHGPGWHSLRTASELPIVGPVTHPFVQGQSKEAARQRREAGE